MTRRSRRRAGYQGLTGPWYLALLMTFSLGLGVLASGTAITPPRLLVSLSKTVRADGWWPMIGVLMVAIPATHMIVFAAMDCMRALFLLRESPRENLWPPAILGILESLMYPIALFLDGRDFIGLWLLLKVAGQWPRWGFPPEGRPPDRELDQGRRRYLRFLVGNALQLLFALLTQTLMRSVAGLPLVSLGK